MIKTTIINTPIFYTSDKLNSKKTALLKNKNGRRNELWCCGIAALLAPPLPLARVVPACFVLSVCLYWVLFMPWCLCGVFSASSIVSSIDCKKGKQWACVQKKHSVFFFFFPNQTELGQGTNPIMICWNLDGQQQRRRQNGPGATAHHTEARRKLHGSRGNGTILEKPAFGDINVTTSDLFFLSRYLKRHGVGRKKVANESMRSWPLTRQLLLVCVQD